MCGLRGRDMGMIFQEPMTALNPVQTIGDQVAETLIVHGAANRAEAAQRAREKLDRVGLPAADFPLSRYPHELSGGQRQRVCIAMAVALRPKLLIADEPTTALDVTTQAQILDLLKGLVQEEGMSLMLITHDLAVVAGLADHVAVMREGRVVEAGAGPRGCFAAGPIPTRRRCSRPPNTPERVPWRRTCRFCRSRR
jgi:peptide/nickel transport system ATP-binding protein